MVELGKLVVAEGLDLSGKGTFLDAMLDRAREQGFRIYDAHPFWEVHDYHPTVDRIMATKPDIVYLSEPTYALTGRHLRGEFYSKTAASQGRHYSGIAVASAFALDRQILLEQVEIPLRERGIHVLKSRSVISSLVYQAHQSREDGSGGTDVINIIRNLPGNALALSPEVGHTDVLIMSPPIEEIERRRGRAKNDDAILERLDFQAAIKPVYEGEWLREICEGMGARVYYPPTDTTEDDTIRLARDHFDMIFDSVVTRGL